MSRCSIVIPAYNAGRFLTDTLQSVRAQTFADFECVVVDDGSKDNTAELARGYSDIRLIRQANAGVAAARNRGARESQSDWLAFLDADDLWMPEKLDRQIDVAGHDGRDAVFCDLQIVDIDGRPLSEPPPVRVDLGMEALLLHLDTIPQGTSSTLLVRRSVFDSIGGYDETLATMADWDLLIRLRQATTFAHVPKQLAAYRRYPGTMSRSVAMLERESMLILDKIFGQADLPEEWRRLETRSRAWNDFVLSGSHFSAGQKMQALVFGGRAMMRDPRLLPRLLGAAFRSTARRLRPRP